VDADVVFIRTGPIQVAAVSSGATQLAYAGPASILGAASSGTDLRMIASFTNRLTYTMIARPSSKKRKTCATSVSASKRSRIGVDGSGARLEYLGLDQRRDNINILNIGDQTVLAQAMESGTIDVTVLDGVFSRRAQTKGLFGHRRAFGNQDPYVSNVIVGTRALFQHQPELAKIS